MENLIVHSAVLKWVFAAVPILVLLITILGFKWSAPKSGAAAWIAALLCGWLFFGANGFVLSIASAKGLSLSLFVLLVIWTGVFLYNLVERLGAIGVIGSYISSLSGSRLGQALLLGWAFSGFMQGIAGFGVPVAVITPLMLTLGFTPVTAAVSVLVGHSWAVTFGSMGSSYYTIQLVTGIPGNSIGPTMAILFALPIIATGFCVAHIVGGLQSLPGGSLGILIVGAIMAFFVWLMAYLGAPQVASLVPGLIGCGVIWLLSKTSLFGQNTGGEVDNPKASSNGLSFHLAFLPYYILILVTIVSQFSFVNKATGDLSWGINYPRLETSLGYVAEPVKAYAKIRLLNHPAPLILASALLTFIIFSALGRWKRGAGLSAIKSTYKQCVPTSMGIATMVMMALIMTDTGMTEVLAKGIAQATEAAFPIFSPYIGVLGCFMTGSNTNSNVMFGALQIETAKSLGISILIIASIQSIGGSLGSAIAPAKVLIGSTLAGLRGREADVMRKAMPYCLILVLLVGLEAWLTIYVF